jgi:hypothetical protein
MAPVDAGVWLLYRRTSGLHCNRPLLTALDHIQHMLPLCRFLWMSP